MIQDLTKANLCHFGISDIQINTTDNRLFTFDIKNAKIIYVSKSEKNIYTDSDYYDSKHYYRNLYFKNKNELSFPTERPDLIPEYYDSMLIKFLHQEDVKNNAYNVEFNTRIFISEETKKHEFDLKRHKSRIIILQANKLIEYEQSIETAEKYLDYLDYQFNQLGKEPSEYSHLITPEKKLYDFIYNINDKSLFMNDLKTEFPIEKGKSIRAIIDYLIIEKIIIIGNRQLKLFYDLLQNDFERDLGTYQSINDVKFDNKADLKLIETILVILKPLVIKYKI